MTRLTTDQIKPGRSYRLMPYYTPCRQLIRRVEAIQDGNVVVLVNGEDVRMPVRELAALAVEEVE
jgi:hypothetical protein